MRHMCKSELTNETNKDIIRVHLHMKTCNVSVKSMQGVPFIILAFRSVLALCALDVHFCQAHTVHNFGADFYPTVKAALRH